MDVKLQVYAGTACPSKVDFRKTTGGYVGAPEDNHRTIYEFRVGNEQLIDAGMTEEDLIYLLAKLNKMMATDAPIKVAFRVYDND